MVLHFYVVELWSKTFQRLPGVAKKLEHERLVVEVALPMSLGSSSYATPSTDSTHFAEKGIMLCKAAAMGDLAMFDEILRGCACD